jgi:hypothetical protein
MKICVAFLVSLGLGISCVSNASAQSPCPPGGAGNDPNHNSPPFMTLKIFNDEPAGGSYIFPVISTVGTGERLAAWFCVGTPASYPSTQLSRIYINPNNGIAPQQSVILHLPLYTVNVPGGKNPLPDPFIDWWTAGNMELFYSSSTVPPRELTELVTGNGPNNPNQAALPNLVGLPTCDGCTGMSFFHDTAGITKNNPSQLIEYNLGALQICNNAVSNICINRPSNNQTTLDIRNVDIDVSYVNVAFGPAALAPFDNDQTGFVGTPQNAETFSVAVNKFLFAPGSPGASGWPQFVHKYSDGSQETLLKLASPLEVFTRLAIPSKCDAAGTCSWDPPPDLCGLSSSIACSTAIGPLVWPGALWPPLQALVTGWRQHAGTVETFPTQYQQIINFDLNSLPLGPFCRSRTPAPGTFCAAILDVKQLLLTNYKNYVFRMNAKGCPFVPMNDFVLIASLYGWQPFTAGFGGCSGLPGDATGNLLQLTPFTPGQQCDPNGKDNNCGYGSNNFALYNQVKAEFDNLNYNLLTDAGSQPYNFNPWVNVFIHGPNFVNALNVYAYSVDDQVGNLQAEGTGFITDVGSSKNLCTGPNSCPNQSAAGEPIHINLAPNNNPTGDPNIINFTNYGVCQFTPNEKIPGLTYKPVNALSSSFIINASNPQQCPIFLVDSKNPPQLYTFTITQPPTKFTFFQDPSKVVSDQTTAAVIDCSGNGNPSSVPAPPPPNPPNSINAAYGQSSLTWCCLKLAPPPPPPHTFIQGVFAFSQPPGAITAHATVSNNVTTIPAKKTTTEPVIGTICNMGQ